LGLGHKFGDEGVVVALELLMHHVQHPHVSVEDHVHLPQVQLPRQLPLIVGEEELGCSGDLLLEVLRGRETCDERLLNFLEGLESESEVEED
jgi:hypothetical protein